MGLPARVLKESTLVRPCNGQRVRVAHLVTRLTLAGVGNVVASLVRGMPSQQYQSIVWCLEEGDVVGSALRDEGYEVVELGKRRRRDLAMFFRLAALVRKEQIDILHCHDELSWFYGAIGGRLGAVPQVVVTVHGRRFDLSRRHLWEQKLLARLSTAIIGVSSSLGQQIIDELGVSPDRATVIRNGVSLRPIQPRPNQRRLMREALGISEGAVVAGCVGRLDPAKNLDLLLEAAADALTMIPSLRVVLVGDGPCREHLSQRSAALGLESVVVFAGLRKDIVELLSALDLYVCSSDREGVSLSILEAMAAELPIIATAVGGNPEVVQDGETGILIERGNRQALARAIAELSLDDRRRRCLGRQARVAVTANFSVERMLREYDQLYHAKLEVPS